MTESAFALPMRFTFPNGKSALQKRASLTKTGLFVKSGVSISPQAQDIYFAFLVIDGSE